MSQSKKKDNTSQSQERIQALDPVEFGNAIMNAYQKAQPILEDYIEKYSQPEGLEEFTSYNFDPLNVRETYLDFIDRVIQKPEKYMEIQTEYMQDWLTLWQNSVQKFMGEEQQAEIIPHIKPDRRFKAQEWQESALFDFIKKSYLLTCHHIEKSIHSTEGLNNKQKKKLSFQSKLMTDALSPTNFALTNPEVINETINTGGQNLVKGFENLMGDLKRGGGQLNISTTKYDAFKLGENIAVTKGQVVYQNDLMQLIQYAPKTNKVFKTPLLIVPPWINKYYILDLRKDKSLIQWLVEQGHTVFVISWVNPNADLAQKKFEDYMFEGILASLEEITRITGEEEINATGYCLGGTLLTTTLAYLWNKNPKEAARIKSATFLTTLIDFEHAGDMKLFLDDEQIDHLETMMNKHGVLQGKELHKTFSLMRANDLIWSFVINNYLLGKEPFPFDLLYWNDDCTNMPAAMHSFYLRNMYRDNQLIKEDGLVINNIPIDISKIKTPCHFISAKEDHIAPWIATYEGAKLLNGDVTFTLAGSGHIAGIVNPPEKKKYSYWVNNAIEETSDTWLTNTTEHNGSWWPFWQEWIRNHAGEKISSRKIKEGIEPAPGRYAQQKR